MIDKPDISFDDIREFIRINNVKRIYITNEQRRSLLNDMSFRLVCPLPALILKDFFEFAGVQIEVTDNKDTIEAMKWQRDLQKRTRALIQAGEQE